MLLGLYDALACDVRFGSKADIDWRPLMSALPPKADIAGRFRCQFLDLDQTQTCRRQTTLQFAQRGGSGDRRKLLTVS
jgi:hypothetical protein